MRAVTILCLVALLTLCTSNALKLQRRKGKVWINMCCRNKDPHMQQYCNRCLKDFQLLKINDIKKMVSYCWNCRKPPRMRLPMIPLPGI